ncbi:helix-hairpin-helix domain-containing protein [Patescibacteria group bacterium]|nr:helix-hairpin-helix domain-containing protein [Patescibacteria group bacterium]
MINLFNKYATAIGLVLIIGLIAGTYIIIQRISKDESKENNQQIVVEIAGAIKEPGVYNFSSTAIVEDLIKRAGGITEDADIVLMAKIINRAALLNDHGKIYIPPKQDGENIITFLEDQVSVSGSSIVGLPITTGLININTADAKGLDTLPGVGPITAGRIIDYRTAKNGFKKKEDLMKVQGIGNATYNKLKDKITV